MTVFEQMFNLQEYGDKGGKMNINTIRAEMFSNHQEKQKKKKEKEETQTFIERFIMDMIKSTGNAVIRQVVDEVLSSFNSMNW